MAVDLDAISDYVWRMERTGSSPCYVGTKELREMIAELKAARKVVEAAREVVENYLKLPEDAPSLGVYHLEKKLKELDGEHD